MARSANLEIMIRAATKAARSARPRLRRGRAAAGIDQGPGRLRLGGRPPAEHVIKEELKRGRPDYGFVMEESGIEIGRSPHNRWIVDPLDGTTNFLHGLPHWAISIALEQHGEMTVRHRLRPLAQRAVQRRAGPRRLCQRPAAAGVQAQRHAHGADRLRPADPELEGPRARLHPPDGEGRRRMRRPAPAGRRPRSTWPMSPPAARTATGSTAPRSGTSPPACCWCARPAAAIGRLEGDEELFAEGTVVAGNPDIYDKLRATCSKRQRRSPSRQWSARMREPIANGRPSLVGWRARLDRAGPRRRRLVRRRRVRRVAARRRAS